MELTAPMELTAVLLLSCLWQLSQALCVLEVGVGNLGMSVNCRFKKSSIVRVRNLGGIKGYVDVGLSLGDEMGFSPTFSQTEERRRSTQAKRGSNSTAQTGSKRLSTGFDGALKLLQAPRSETTGAGSAATSPAATGSAATSPAATGSAATSPAATGSAATSPAATGSAATSPAATGSAATSAAFRKVLRAAGGHFQDLAGMATAAPGVARRAWVRKAPREYYPLGYPELPGDSTSSSSLELAPEIRPFRCEAQKYLPGLYADRQQGCRVFHACVDSSSGSVVARAYACPLYTLFDQSVLRCNWWFYVDCGAAEKLYDSNAPIASTYGLVKALFFPIENEA
ncbi:uncharacterized protein LOC134532457 [Bacillus rossius redtenbacheri]|uniref:uncharacterized protein LOC134532457 n=1 Tax=Bacillus rossius redtenbacheri TaxID=93214 RepID=UPI002FDDDF63